MEKNLENKEALEKFIKLVKEINVCMFITNQSENEHTRPMATIDVEDNGLLWFFTDIRSLKVEEVSTERTVHLTYAHPGKESYLDVWGQASVVTDKNLIKEKWSPIVKAWFPKGVDDPNIALLKIQPNETYYWDAETGKMVQFFKMAAAAITGKQLADGAQGQLKV
ncbi:MAG TPA: pyridoxamine 5'-phosphate oxidase family protein [Flavisolibacter sp.]|jgi:general stress protein 26|nr:pyridoxamine 5'-phosphate oxidase family protein [Flavisolibacter sp.]